MRERESEMRVMSGQDRCFYSEGAGASFDAGTTEDEGKPASFCRTPPPSGETRIHSCGSSLLPSQPRHQHSSST